MTEWQGDSDVVWASRASRVKAKAPKATPKPTRREQVVFVLGHAAITLVLVLALLLALALMDDPPRDFTVRGFEGELQEGSFK